MALYDDVLGGDGGARSTRGQIRRVLRYVRTHLHEPLDVQTLADLARLSRAHFTRVFTHSGGDPHRLSRGFLGCEGRVEERSGFEHGAGDV